MLQASLEGLLLIFSVSSLTFMFLGIAFGLLIGFLPGLGGIVAMALLLPFTFGMSPPEAFALLIGAHTGTIFGSSITSILFNVPGASKSVVVCFDGFPMTQRGEGVRALAAGATASLLGGIIGALVLTVSLPLMKMVMLALAPPEYFMMAIWGLTIIAIFSEGSVLKGLVAAGFGLAIAFIGMDPVTGTARYTFGISELVDGFDIPVAIMGLFAISQMIKLYVKGGSIVERDQSLANSKSGLIEGIKDAFRHWRTVLQASFLGVFIGALPGVGASVASIAAYGAAVQTSKTPERFGKGAVEGVIAPEATNASSEGGHLIPTLAFGIPGSEVAVILLAAFVMLGIQPGREMLEYNLPLVFNLVWLIVLTNVFSTGFGLMMSPYLVRMTALPGNFLIPIILAVCVSGAYAMNKSMLDVVVAMVFGIIGYYMDKYNYSRADMVIGMVLALMIERYMQISLTLYGSKFLLERPLTLVFAVLIILSVIYPFARRIMAKRKAVLGG
ncbi:MAG: membrane protein [Clostridiaceae bacterium BRH_c20a]|nr:MAG: membrane protein [Clostridiaceae bacterium BRH_c20a]